MYKLTCGVAVAVAGVASQAVAAVINVPGNQPTIQAAIDVAVNGDEIVVAPGTYFEIINFLGKAIWLHSSDGPHVTIIDAQDTGTVVTCESGEGPKTVLEGFTITGGNGSAGGGMRNASSSPTVIGCIFSGNTADSGGGMRNSFSSTTVTNCVFSGNTAVGLLTPGVGGGIWNSNSSAIKVRNCTFSGNSANFGGGMANSISSSMVTNCVLWGDSPDEIAGGTPTVTFSDVQGGFPGIGNIDVDPLFVDPDNGDYRLSAGSPCIDAGDNTAVPEGISTDLDGNPRFVDDPDTPNTGNPGAPGPIVDMGAYEFQLPCPWDLNGDGTVNFPDLLLLLGDFGSCDGSQADFDGDECVTVADLLALIANFGPCPGSQCVWDVNGDGFVDNDDLQ